MNAVVSTLLVLLGVVCVAIPSTAVAVVYRDELRAPFRLVRRALAFDPRHPGLDPHPTR